MSGSMFDRISDRASKSWSRSIGSVLGTPDALLQQFGAASRGAPDALRGAMPGGFRGADPLRTSGFGSGRQDPLRNGRWQGWLGTNWMDVYNQRLANEASQGGAGQAPPGVEGQGRGLEGTFQWKDLIDKAAQEAGIPPEVIQAIMGIESGGNQHSVSVAGAQGLMQIMPDIWGNLARQFGGNLMDPWTNIRTGAEILKTLFNQYGSWDKAAAAYLGAIDANGNISGATDAYGTSGYTYVDLFNQNLYVLQNQNSVNPGGVDLAQTGGLHNVVNFAQQALGVEYVWGGADYNGFDCSGLTLWAYAQAGIDLPRTAQEQYNATTRVSEPRVGDLVFFSGDGVNVTHVGIYAGNGVMIHAPSEGSVVRVDNLSDPWYREHFVGYGRV